MNNETTQLIAGRWEQLPARIQSLLLSETLLPSIRIIAEKHHLPDDKAIALEREVLLTLLAFETLNQFDEHLMAELLIPGSLASSIMRDIDTMIFAQVRPELDLLILEQETAEEQEKVSEPLEVSDTATTTSDAAPEQPLYEPPRTVRPVSDMPRYVKEDPYRESPR